MRLSSDAKRFLLLCFTTFVLFGLCRLSEAPIEVRIQSDENGVLATVNGTPLHSSQRIDSLSRVAVKARPSPFPTGLSEMSLWQKGVQVASYRFQGDFKFRHRNRLMPVGDWTVDNGVASEEVFSTALTIKGPFELRATFYGPAGQGRGIVLSGSTNLSYEFRRGVHNNDAYLSIAGKLFASGSPPTLHETHLRIVRMAVEVLFAGCLWATLVLAAGLLLRHAKVSLVTVPPPKWPSGVALLLISMGVGFLGWMKIGVLEKIPHLQDSLLYVMMAKWFSRGIFVPPASLALDFPAIPFTAVVGSHWLPAYPIGWPIILAIGEWFGVPWLITPLCGAVYFFLLFRIGTLLYGVWGGAAACLFATLSPALITIFAEDMAHACGGVFVIAGCYLFLRAKKERRIPYYLLSGVCLGYVAGIRPYSAAVTCMVVAVFHFIDMITVKKTALRLRIQWSAIAIAGIVLGALPALTYNKIAFGSFLTFGYSLGGELGIGAKAYPGGIVNANTMLAYLIPTLFGWGWKLNPHWLVLAAPFGLAILPFLLNRADREDCFLGSLFLAIVAAHAFQPHSGHHGYGARYYSETFFALFLLAAKGAMVLDDLLYSPSQLAGRTAGLVTLLVALLGLSNVVTLHERMGLYRNYNGINGNMARQIATLPTTRAVILLPQEPKWENWARVAPYLSPDRTGDKICLVQNGPERPVAGKYLGRPVYHVTWTHLKPGPPPPAK